MNVFKALTRIGKGKVDRTPGTAIRVYDVPQRDDQSGAAAVKGTEVAIWRPPVMLDMQGRSIPGVSKALIARYLVSATSALAEADLGPVSVEWKAQVGRFVETEFTVHAWGQLVTLIHPIAPVSQELANTWEMYKGAMARKVRELHKGHQKFGDANRILDLVEQKLENLRDEDVPQFSDAEFLFLDAAFHQAKVLSALIPVSDVEAEEVVGESMTVG